MIGFTLSSNRRLMHHWTVPGLAPFEKSGKTFRYLIRHLLFGFRTTAISLLIIVLARPQSLTISRCFNRGIDIILTLDISGSMLARDFRPDRVEASKNIATEFITGRP